MRSQKLPVNNKASNTLFMEFYNFLNLSLDKPSKTNHIKSLGLLASISFLGLTVSLVQSVQAQTIVSSDQSTTAIANLRSLDDTTAENQFNPSIGLIQPEFNLAQTGNAIPQLPSLKIAQAVPKKVFQKIYTVKSGDTLTSIARQYGVSSSQIIQANQLTNPNFIKVNHQLVIPQLNVAKEDSSSTIKVSAKNLTNNSSTTENKILIADAATSSASLSSLVEKKAESRSKKVTRETDLDLDSTSQENSNVDNSTSEDVYISKLRQDIVKLRNKYQQQSGDDETIAVKNPPVSLEKTVIETNPKTDINAAREILDTKAASSEIKQAIAPNTVAMENFNSLVGISNSNINIPNLPPLASPEEYLPDNPIFNGYIWPAKGTLTSGYGWRWGRMHKGIDIAAPVGTPIMAAASGEVIFAGWNSGGYGNLVKLKHHDGSITFYAHNHRVLVNNGQRVKQGQLIAEMGSTGRSTGPHLHFEIRPNGSTAINPMARLPKNR